MSSQSDLHLETSPLKWVEHKDISCCRHNNKVAQVVWKNAGWMICIMSDLEYERACKNHPYRTLYTGFEWVHEKAIAVASKYLLEE